MDEEEVMRRAQELSLEPSQNPNAEKRNTHQLTFH